MVIFPILKNFEDYKWEYVHLKVSEEAAQNDFIVIDLLDNYKKYNEEEIKITKTDFWHPNKLGHRIAADVIYEKLINLRVI